MADFTEPWSRLTREDVERAHREAEAEVGIVRPPTPAERHAAIDRALCEIFDLHDPQSRHCRKKGCTGA